MIRRAKQEDLEGTLKLLYQLSPSKGEKVTQRQRMVFGKIIKADYQELLVYGEGGKIIGTATVTKRENLTHQGRPAAYIENVVTDKKYRRQGIGKKLVDECLKIARRWNCYKVNLICELELARFYGKSGFEKFKGIAMRVDIN